MVDLPAVTHPDNQDNEPSFVFLEYDPIGPDAEPIKGFFRAAEALDIVLKRRRIPGQDQQLCLDDLLMRPVDLFQLIARFFQKHKLIHSDPQVFPDVFGID